MRLTIGIFALLFSGSVFSESASYARCAPDGVAMGGYDVVSYRAPGGPVSGVVEFSSNHEGLTYLFSTGENRSRFLADPDAYLPHYQGWCAATLAMGRLTCPDFTNFKIEDGALLLFELAGFTNGRVVWDSNPGDFRRRADMNAKRLLGL